MSVKSIALSLLFALHRTVVFLSTSICPIAVCVDGLVGLVLATLDKSVSLEGIFSRKALAAKCTRERLNSQMDSLVALQIMVTTERLSALITLERSL